jgi:hypothetical protein
MPPPAILTPDAMRMFHHEYVRRDTDTYSGATPEYTPVFGVKHLGAPSSHMKCRHSCETTGAIGQ